MIRNCPTDQSSIKDASIFGLSIPNLQGKNTCPTQDHVILNIITPIPPIILTCHRKGVLRMDVVKINNFFVTYASTVKFCTATQLKDAAIPTLTKIISTIKALYGV